MLQWNLNTFFVNHPPEDVMKDIAHTNHSHQSIVLNIVLSCEVELSRSIVLAFMIVMECLNHNNLLS
jgi:hypothetical protein